MKCPECGGVFSNHRRHWTHDHRLPMPSRDDVARLVAWLNGDPLPDPRITRSDPPNPT